MKRLWAASLCALSDVVCVWPRNLPLAGTCASPMSAGPILRRRPGSRRPCFEGLGYKPTKDDRFGADYVRGREEQADRRVPRLLVADAWTR